MRFWGGPETQGVPGVLLMEVMPFSRRLLLRRDVPYQTQPILECYRVAILSNFRPSTGHSFYANERNVPLGSDLICRLFRLLAQRSLLAFENSLRRTIRLPGDSGEGDAR